MPANESGDAGRLSIAGGWRLFIRAWPSDVLGTQTALPISVFVRDAQARADRTGLLSLGYFPALVAFALAFCAFLRSATRRLRSSRKRTCRLFMAVRLSLQPAVVSDRSSR